MSNPGDWWEYHMWKKEWFNVTDCNGVPTAVIDNDGMAGARRLHLKVYFPEERMCVYREHLPVIKEAIEKFEQLLSDDK